MTTTAAKLETITSRAGLLLDGPKSHMSCPLPPPHDKSAVERVGRLPVIITLSPFPYTLIIKRVPVDVVGKFFQGRDEKKRGV